MLERLHTPEGYPLAPMQAGMLYESVLAPASGVNLQQIVISFPDGLDQATFEGCWQSLAERHAVLRTSFRWLGLDQPMQEVSTRVLVPFEVMDLRGQADGAQQARIQAYLCEDRRRGFDLTAAPLMRVAVFRLDEARHESVWTFHHILLDGRSIASVIDELFTLYDARRRGEEPRLEDRPPYREFIDRLTQREVESSREYWRALLEAFSPPAPLSILPQPGTTPERGSQETRLPESLAAALRSFAAANEVTLNTLIQGAWAILLGRYSRADDVVFGATRACRRSTIEDSDRVVGLFINTLPVRARVGADAGLLDLLKDLRSQSLAVRPHEHTPLVSIKEWCGLAGSQPLFETLVVFERYRRESDFDTAWLPRRVRQLQQTSFPLTLGVCDRSEPRVSIGYDRRRFGDAAIGRLLGHFRTILEEMASGRIARIGEFTLLTPTERRQLLVDWASSPRECPAACVHELFEERATRHPERVAVVFENNRITYGELDSRANRIAHHLRRMGVGPEEPVGLLAERSLEMVAAMLGILKSGGAYVPLDPAYPEARLALMLQDSGAAVLLAHGRLRTPRGAGSMRALNLESAGEGFPDTRPERAASPGNLAYVMYTSGSTGRPKGVEIEHRNVAGFLHSFRPFDCEGETRAGTNVASFSFDTSVEEIFSCLCFGGTVHVVRPEHSTDARCFARYLKHRGINCSYIVPDMLEPVAAALAKLGGPLRLKTVLTGLSPKPERALQAFRNLSPDLRVLNAYGPTEVTYGATCYEFDQARDPDREAPIGRPFSNYRVYIVDEAMQLAPVGVAGELLIGGVGVARGYRGQPDLTRKKFIPDPYGGGAGGLLYRSGDLVRRLEDGNIEFLGRIDGQVKIRGYRVEPGEIESVLVQHPGVARAAVAAKQSPAGDMRLVAYIVAADGSAASPAGLRQFVRERLPEYMLPSTFHRLGSLPLLASGKVDWKSLPEPDWVGQESRGASQGPRDAFEASLLRSWERVLRVRPIGITDNFFDLGGHSLLAVRLFSEMERTFGENLPLSWLLQAPTVERMADLLRRRDLVPAWSALVPIQPRGARPPLFGVHANGGDVLFYRALAQHLGEDQPFYGLRSPGLDAQPALESVEDMAAHYIRQVRSLQPDGPYYLGGFCLGAYVALEMARRLESDGQQVAFVGCFATDGSWRKTRSFRGGVAAHLSRLSRLRTAGKAAYLAGRLGFRWLRAKHSLASRGAGLLLELGFRLPPRLRMARVFEQNYQANLRYLARPYSGGVTCFEPEQSLYGGPEEFWGEVARGGLEVHTVPGKDEDIFREPHVSVLAERLRECLDRAQRLAL